jgi:hypothetical protein
MIRKTIEATFPSAASITSTSAQRARSVKCGARTSGLQAMPEPEVKRLPNVSRLETGRLLNMLLVAQRLWKTGSTRPTVQTAR